MKPLSFLCVFFALVLSACITDSASSGLEKSRGVVLSYPPELVWQETKITLQSLGQVTDLDDDERSLDVSLGRDQVVLAAIDDYDRTGTKAILRVTAQRGKTAAPDIASQITARIQERLLRSRR